jgi:hypothetical protein
MMMRLGVLMSVETCLQPRRRTALHHGTSGAHDQKGDQRASLRQTPPILRQTVDLDGPR